MNQKNNQKNQIKNSSMASRIFRFSLKELSDIPSRTKLFPNQKKQHQRNNSISISSFASNNQSEKIVTKPKDSKASLLKKNSALIEQLASYGTNHKGNDDNNGTMKAKKRCSLFKNDEKNEGLLRLGEKLMRKKNWTNSVKKSNKISRMLSSKKLSLNNKKYNNSSEKEKEKDIIIVRKKAGVSIKSENFLTLPEELKFKLFLPNLSVVPPSKNIEGNYSYYINSVANSLKEFLNFQYEDIFSKENFNKVNYFYYTTPMIIEDAPKKKLLLIDLDETLIHSEFRNQQNFEQLESCMKSSKCIVKTFSFTDESFTYILDVYFRPYLKTFLKEVSEYFDLAIFTAATKIYADTILDYIDQKNEFFKFRLYREACIPIQNKVYIKDLRIIKDYDPSNVILMDNSLYSFMNQPSNGMLVNSFYMNHKDIQLINAKDFLINHISPCDDVRKECEKWYHFTELFNKDNNNNKGN